MDGPSAEFFNNHNFFERSGACQAGVPPGTTTVDTPIKPAAVQRFRSRPQIIPVGAALFLLFAQMAVAVPGNEADPPMPPTDFGNLFDDGTPRVQDCRIDLTRSDASQSTITFRSNFPYNRGRFWASSSTWSSWTSLSTQQYVCTAPQCLWLGGEVEIRGCKDAVGTVCPRSCTVKVGMGAGGLPVVNPAGLPVPIANHAGCSQSSHTEVSFVASWSMTSPAATGYPRVFNTNGNPVALTLISSVTNAGVFTGTYTIPAGWTAGFEGTWSFRFDLDAGRSAPVNVQVSEHCLNAPQVYQVDSSLTRTQVYDGATVTVGSASQMVIESGNSGLTLAHHFLDPATQTLGTVFTLTQPPTGTTVTEVWSEVGDGWDGREYTSPDVNIELTSSSGACVSDGTHRFWLDPASPSGILPDSTAATTVATVWTDACAGVVGTAPVITPRNWHSIYGTVQVFWSVLAGSEATGWPVQATPARAIGMITDGAAFTGSGWPSSGEEIRVDRADATTCPPGERVNAGICEPCPDYQACVDGVVTTTPWCAAGNPPADATMASYQVCSGNSLSSATACLNPGDSVPASAYTTQVQSCVDGTTQNVTVCVAGGDSAPTDAPCTSCPPGEELVGPDCVPCSSTETYCVGTRPIASCTDVDNRSATRLYCQDGVQESEPITGTCTDDDDRSATRWYCQDGASQGEPITGTCTDDDDRTATRLYCQNGVQESETLTGTCTDADDRSATRLYCLLGTQESETLTGTCTDADDRSATRLYCQDGVQQSETLSNTCTDADDREATETYCSGDSAVTRTITGTCTDVDNTGATETYCSDSSATTRPISGCTDSDLRPTSCSGGDVLNTDGCCEEIESCDTPTSSRPACSSGEAWSWNSDPNACAWESSSVPQPDCCTGPVSNVPGYPPGMYYICYTSCSHSWSSLSCSWITTYSGSAIPTPMQ